MTMMSLMALRYHTLPMAGQSADTLYYGMVSTTSQDEISDGTIKSVAVTAQILEALAGSGGPVRLAELSRQLDMPRARIHRYLKTLRELGYVSQERNGERYWLGTRLFHLGQAAMEQFEITRIADRPMHELRETFGQTIVLSTPVNCDALVVAVVESENVVQISVRPGARLPALTSAQGRIALAYAPAAVRDRLLATVPSGRRSQVEKQLRQIRERLYEFSSGETLGGINVLAAPILSDGDSLAGIMAVVGAAQDIAEDTQAITCLQAQTGAISATLGSSAYS